MIQSRWIWGGVREGEMTKSFYFGDDGLVKVYKNYNEHSWSIKNGTLEIYNGSGGLSWKFVVVDIDMDGDVTLVGRYLPNDKDPIYFYLREYRKQYFNKTENIKISDNKNEDKNENIRLIIWDMDETFWKGTLSEGDIELIKSNVEIVKELNKRGIINAICSKNDFDEVKSVLEKHNLWDDFVFPEISFSPKGTMIKNIIDNVQLRPETVMFIDDNITNLHEAKFYVPAIKIAEPDILAGLLDNPLFKGKPDPQLSRLKRYKVLEQKAEQKAASGGDNEQFLRDSEISISIHSDIDNHFTRIHDLVNRTNQLNFTKHRWPENIEDAHAQFLAEVNSDFDTHAGYVKVADRYGNYGICGFFLIVRGICHHFLFSCRTMNMGVEQYVWHKLGRPFIAVREPVASDVDMPVDWIKVVADVDNQSEKGSLDRLKVCIRGACDMMMMSHFLRARVDTIEEFNYPYQGWGIYQQPRVIVLHDELKEPQNKQLIEMLPGIPKNRFESAVIAGNADAFVLSFSQESFSAMYRSKSTGMIIPMDHEAWGRYWPNPKIDLTKIPYQEILDRHIPMITREQWAFFGSEFEFFGDFNPEQFVKDVIIVLEKAKSHHKPVIVVSLNGTIGHDRHILQLHQKINNLVCPLVQRYNIPYIDVNDFVKSENDLASDGGGTHFTREVYKKLADKVLELL